MVLVKLFKAECFHQIEKIKVTCSKIKLTGFYLMQQLVLYELYSVIIFSFLNL